MAGPFVRIGIPGDIRRWGASAGWMAWAGATFGELRKEHPISTVSLLESLDDIEHYFRHRLRRTCILNEAFRWHAEVDPDELEYLLHALFNLDAWLVVEVHRREPCHSTWSVQNVHSITRPEQCEKTNLTALLALPSATWFWSAEAASRSPNRSRARSAVWFAPRRC